MNHTIKCTFSWRSTAYEEARNSITGDLQISSTSGLLIRFSFDVVFIDTVEHLEKGILLHEENLDDELEFTIERIAIRKWAGESYALPYTIIHFPYDVDRNQAEHDLVCSLILDFLNSPNVRRGILVHSFPEREMPMELLVSIMGD